MELSSRQRRLLREYLSDKELKDELKTGGYTLEKIKEEIKIVDSRLDDITDIVSNVNDSFEKVKLKLKNIIYIPELPKFINYNLPKLAVQLQQEAIKFWIAKYWRKLGYTYDDGYNLYGKLSNKWLQAEDILKSVLGDKVTKLSAHIDKAGTRELPKMPRAVRKNMSV